MASGPSTGFLGISAARWAVLAAVACGLGLLSVFVRDALALEWSVASLRELVDRAGWWGPLFYIGVLTFRFAVLVPSSILLTAAGICFGAVPGALYATVGLTLSALLKYAIASIAGRDFLLRQLPVNWRSRLAVGDLRSTAGGLAVVCAYPLGPKHVFQIGAILSGMSFVRYVVAVSAGATFRASAFSFLGDVVATGQGIVLLSSILLLIAVIPLAVPTWRRWLLSPQRVT